VPEPSALIETPKTAQVRASRDGRSLIVVAVLGLVLSRLREPPTPRRAWAKFAGELAPERMNVILVTVDPLPAERLSERANLGSV
jgi:hypothetical protein